MGNTDIKATISIQYDEIQDRIRLLCNLKKQGEGEIEILLTRHLLKKLLKTAPDWLAEQSKVTRSKEPSRNNSPEDLSTEQTTDKHPILQASNQTQSVTDKKAKPFMIGMINMTSLSLQGYAQMIEVHLVSIDKQQILKLTLSIDQFQILITLITNKATNWDLVNPWLNTPHYADISLCGNAGVLH